MFSRNASLLMVEPSRLLSYALPVYNKELSHADISSDVKNERLHSTAFTHSLNMFPADK